MANVSLRTDSYFGETIRLYSTKMPLMSTSDEVSNDLDIVRERFNTITQETRFSLV